MTYQGRFVARMMTVCFTLIVGTPGISQATDSPTPPPATSPSQPSATQEGEKHQVDRMQLIRKACTADAKKFCAQVKPGGGRILQCLEEHAKEVSSECSNVLEKKQ